MALKDVLLTLVIATLAMLMHSPVMVNGQNILFTVNFDVTNEAGSYNTFITNLRQRLSSGLTAGGVPLLNPAETNRNNYFHLNLISGTSQITLRIRMGDLYFVAFQSGNNQWYEFRPRGQRESRLFPDMVLLPYTSAYNPDRSIQAQTIVGRNILNDAISTLGHYAPDNPNNQQLLISLMIMIPEALRFLPVADFVYTRIHDTNQESPIEARIVDLIHQWGAMSIEMRRSDLFASFRELSNALAPFAITSAAQLISILGLVLCSIRKTPTKPAFTTNAVTDVTTKGRQLVEIFWVQIINIDNENPGDLYGTVQVVDGLTTPQYIFNRYRGSYLSIGPNEFVPLTGPTRAISAYDSFYIDVSLMDYDTLSSDDEVSKGQMVWYYFSANIYDQPLSVEVKGKYGSIGISYAVYSSAVTASVQVTLINGDNENPANVYGTINASNTLSNGAINLFNKKSNQYIDIKPLQLIPLLRSMVVVPLTYSINVVADLWDQDTSSADDPIAQGSLIFVAAESGSNVGIVKGKYGSVQVNVTWSSSWA